VKKFEHPITLTPREYELEVKKLIDAWGASLVSYESAHLEQLAGADGEYAIDIVARFSALGADFVVLVECKHKGRKVERQDVQVLHSKVQSLGAHKGILFSTTDFQSGAIEYAHAHGIALVQMAGGDTCWFTKGIEPSPPPPWANVPKYVGWWHNGNTISLLSEDFGDYTAQALGFADLTTRDK
jgi:restriction system protein